MKNYFKLTVFFVAFCLTAGCSGSKLSGLYQVTGKITHQGKPIEGVTVNFFPVIESSTSRTATGQTDKNGNFILTTLQTNDGAFSGEYKITLRKLLFSMTNEELNDIEKNGRTARIESANIIPDQYQTKATTPLTFTVKSQKNICEIDITENLKKVVFPAWSKYEAQKR
jgi:hypothetical protein